MEGLFMLRDSHKKWKEMICKKGISLLGEILISEQEYEELTSYFINKIVKSDNVIVIEDINISLFLVQVAIREYSDGNYWSQLEKVLECKVIQSRRNNTNEIFYKTLRFYNLFILPITNNKIPYNEMIKAHAFVTNNYMNGFFDFVNMYFERVLFRQVDKNDISKDLSALSDFMKDNLEYTDNISIKDSCGKNLKSYKLLKSTRIAIAYIDNSTLTAFLYPILKMIDIYYYDSVYPKDQENRFNSAFIKWCETQQTESNSRKNMHIRKIGSRKPYIYIDNNGESKLVIPAQKFRPDECRGLAYANIIIGDEEEKEIRKNLDVYKQFGLYISDEFSITIPSPFEHIEIEIYSTDNRLVKSFHIGESTYCILDKNNKSVNKIKKEDNKILVRKNITPYFNEFVEVIDELFAENWNLYSVNCSLGSEITISGRTLHYTNEDYTDVVYENEETIITNTHYYYVTDTYGNIVKCVSNHPIIVIYTDKILEDGIFIYVDNEKWTVKEIKENFENAILRDIDSDFKSKIKITINLDKLYYSETGYYKVYVDIPGKRSKAEICRYICFPNEIKIKRNKSFYYYGRNITIDIVQEYSEIKFMPLFVCDESSTFSFNDINTMKIKTSCCNIDGKSADFNFKLDDNAFVLHIPVPKFMYGASAECLECKPTKLWYKDLNDNLYICIPGAVNVTIKFDWDKKEYISIGNHIKNYIFQFDLTEINNLIKSVDNRSHMFIKILYTTIKQIETSIVINRQLNVIPYFTPESMHYKSNENQMILNIEKIEFSNRASLYIEIEERSNNEIIFDSPIHEGENIISNIYSDKNYTIRPYMIEKTLFSKRKTYMRWIKIEGEKDISDISKYNISIKSISGKGKIFKTSDFFYGIDCLKKCEGTNNYTGRLFVTEYINNKPDFKNKKPLGSIILKVYKDESPKTVCSISMLDYDSQDYAELYYDNKRKMLLSPNNKLLLSSNYQDFIPLYEEETVFTLELRERRGRKNDIQTD